MTLTVNKKALCGIKHLVQKKLRLNRLCCVAICSVSPAATEPFVSIFVIHLKMKLLPNMFICGQIIISELYYLIDRAFNTSCPNNLGDMFPSF